MTGVARLYYSVGMATTTVRLDDQEEEALDHLAQLHGGRSNALRRGLRLLAEQTQKSEALAELLADWQAEEGPVTEASIAEATKRFGL